MANPNPRDDKDKKVLSTYVDPDLAQQVEAEAQEKQVSTAAVLRWALKERYDKPQPQEQSQQKKTGK